MSIDEANLIVQTVVAVCAVAGVFVATWLGQKSTRLALESAKISREAADIAKEAQIRAEKDYLSGRADFIAANLSDVMDQVAQFRADMHVFWKEIPRGLLEAPKEYELTKGLRTKDLGRNLVEERVIFLDQHRLLGEVGVHGSIYRLNAAGIRLADSVESVKYLPVSDESHDGCISAASTVAFIKVVLRSVYPHYLALIPEQQPPAPQDSDFKEWFFANLDMVIDTKDDRLALQEAKRWMGDKLRSDSKYSTGEITQNFIEHFAVERLIEEVSKLTATLYKSAVPVAVKVGM